MLVMVVFFIAFRWIHLSTPLIRLFLLVLILLLMPTLNFLPVWFALSLLRFRLPSRLAIIFMLVAWFGLTLSLLRPQPSFRGVRFVEISFVSSHLSGVIYVWCYCWQ